MRSRKAKTSVPINQKYLTSDLTTNLAIIKELLHGSGDCIIREFNIADKIKAAVICIDGLINKQLVEDNLLRPLIVYAANTPLPRSNVGEYIKENVLTAEDVKDNKEIQSILNLVLSGDTALLIDKEENALIIASRGYLMRGVTEPSSEAVVRGPREAFTESLRINTSLIRRKIINPDLVFETLTVGRVTKTLVNIVYIKGLARSELIEEIKKRIEEIDIDGIFDTGYIEQLTEDHPLSPFGTTGFTEKPDVLAARILEGRVGVIVDGTPNALTIPLLFIEKFQTSEDYYSRPLFGSFVRVIRFLAFIISFTSPAIYIILASFQPELLPTPLLITFANALEGTPFPAALEVGIMLFLLEILREAGVRMPRPIGPAVGIVGALVMGESAVTAGLIGQPLVIVIALTAISSYVIPTLYDEGSILRIFLFALTSVFGIIGFAAGIILLLIHLAGLKSFGIPFMSPLMPLEGEDMKDTFIRAPIWLFRRRPQVLGGTVRIRNKPNSSKESEEL